MSIFERLNKERAYRISHKKEDRQKAGKLGWTCLKWDRFYDRWYGLGPGEIRSGWASPRWDGNTRPNQIDDWPWGSQGISRSFDEESESSK